MKSLDQEGRAALRRLGVRFGAYHIFVPALLKPGPAGLVTLLWALDNDGKDKPGFGDVVNALAAGRTSVVVDPAFDRSLLQARRFPRARPPRGAHRHTRAARRPDPPGAVLEARTGQRPDGGYDGNGFIVTPPMMSILGATADDIEEILKGLGYRSDARPAADGQGQARRDRRGARGSRRGCRARPRPKGGGTLQRPSKLRHCRRKPRAGEDADAGRRR